jgi:hypothetical protein
MPRGVYPHPTGPRRDPYVKWARFLSTWQRLEQLGVCDSQGGAEFERVYREWVDAGWPSAVEAFIRKRANIGPCPDPN